MSARPKLDLDEERELTAQPKSIEDELGVSEEHESGLSVDPDDLGRNFLSEAMDQGNFESELRGDAADPSDAALTGPNFESDHDVWENTVNLTMQNGAADDEPLVEDEDAENDALLDANDGLDLTENTIRSGSLLDSETEEAGETREPNARTEDVHTHGRPRGGHDKPPAGGPSKGKKPAAKAGSTPSRGR